MPFYHGTSSVAGIEDKILPPADHSFGINEVGRVKHSQKVFFTTVKGYAEKYARQAVRRAGGVPIVYEVFPSSPKLMVSSSGCDVYFDSEALVVEIYEVKYGIRLRKVKNKKLIKQWREIKNV